MLRLKKAMDDCGIPQKALCEASGFGKSQVSQTLNSGKLPANWEKFRDGVVELINREPMLQNWLNTHHMVAERLLETVATPAPPVSVPTNGPDLERVLCEIAGRAVLAAEGCNSLELALVRCTAVLHRTLSDLVGEDAPYLATKELEIFAILKGVRP